MYLYCLMMSFKLFLLVDTPCFVVLCHRVESSHSWKPTSSLPIDAFHNRHLLWVVLHIASDQYLILVITFCRPRAFRWQWARTNIIAFAGVLYIVSRRSRACGIVVGFSIHTLPYARWTRGIWVSRRVLTVVIIFIAMILTMSIVSVLSWLLIVCPYLLVT